MLFISSVKNKHPRGVSTRISTLRSHRRGAVGRASTSKQRNRGNEEPRTHATHAQQHSNPPNKQRDRTSKRTDEHEPGAREPHPEGTQTKARHDDGQAGKRASKQASKEAREGKPKQATTQRQNETKREREGGQTQKPDQRAQTKRATARPPRSPEPQAATSKESEPTRQQASHQKPRPASRARPRPKETRPKAAKPDPGNQPAPDSADRAKDHLSIA